jgi:hypothetical protein
MILATAALLAALGPLALPLDEGRSDPAVEIQDAYKWIYQAAQGGEHAAPSPEQAAESLQEEWSALDAGAQDEPLTEPLGGSGIVRLNLRAYRAAGGTPDALLVAFLKSAASFTPDRDAFRRTWLELGDRLRLGSVGRLTRAAWERLDAETRPNGYPPVHHSAGFAAIRQPAYRVLTAGEASRLLESLPRGIPPGR